MTTETLTTPAGAANPGAGAGAAPAPGTSGAPPVAGAAPAGGVSTDAAPALPADLAPPTGILATPPKKEGEAAKEGEPKKADEPAALKAEDYKLTLPEGVTADDPVITGFIEAAAEAKVAPEAAQLLLDKVRPQIEAQMRAPYDAWNATQTQWIGEVRADPEIGGAKLDGTVARVAKLMDSYGDPGLRQALDMTGAGNHPGLIRFLNKVAVAMKVDEGKPVMGQPSQPKLSAAQKMFPNNPA
jgi:hypothetical protein